MSGTPIQCPSCKRRNKPDGRYCIYCGKILKSVYCSSCGTPNPEGLSGCLECGNPLPSLNDIRWGPIVTVLQPTGAMTDEVHTTSNPEPSTPPATRELIFTRFAQDSASKKIVRERVIRSCVNIQTESCRRTEFSRSSPLPFALGRGYRPCSLREQNLSLHTPSLFRYLEDRKGYH